MTQNDLPESAKAIPPKPRGRHMLLKQLGLFIITLFVVGEVATRYLTRGDETGGLHVGKITLLPYSIDPAKADQWFAQRVNDNYLIRDEELGWSLKKAAPKRSAESIFFTSPQGFRADVDKVYPTTRPVDKIRLITVGDSFTHGDGMALEQTWQRRLEGKRSDLEIMNLGVPGYGVDQAFLRWKRDGSSFDADAVLLCIWPEDMLRNVNVVRHYLTTQGGCLIKPYFVQNGSNLELRNSPLMSRQAFCDALKAPLQNEILRDDLWLSPGEQQYRFWYDSRFLRTLTSLKQKFARKNRTNQIYSGANSLPTALTVAIAKQFATEVSARGAMPIVVIIPMFDLLENEQKSADSFPLVVQLKSAGLNVIDLGPGFANIDKSKLFLSGGHLNADGNARVAERLNEELQKNFPTIKLPRN